MVLDRLLPCRSHITIRHDNQHLTEAARLLGFAQSGQGSRCILTDNWMSAQPEVINDALRGLPREERPVIAHGHAITLCPNASSPDKEWPFWTELQHLGPIIGSWSPDLLPRILGSRLVIANHSGPAHLARLLGVPTICLQNARWPIDPPGALMMGPAWPTVSAVMDAARALAPESAAPCFFANIC